MFSVTTHKKARHILRPQLASLCARQRVGGVSSDAQNLLVAGLNVVESAQIYGSLLMAQARTNKDCPTIQARDEMAARQLNGIRPESDAATFILVGTTGKHADRKRFNRARYEARKAARSEEAAAASIEPKSKKGAAKKKKAADEEEEAAAAAASPSKQRGKRARAE